MHAVHTGVGTPMSTARLLSNKDAIGEYKYYIAHSLCILLTVLLMIFMRAFKNLSIIKEPFSSPHLNYHTFVCYEIIIAVFICHYGRKFCRSVNSGEIKQVHVVMYAANNNVLAIVG